MLRPAICLVAALASLGLHAQTGPADLDLGARLQLQWDSAAAAAHGPLARANALQPGTSSTPAGATLSAELRASTRGWSALFTLQQQALHNQAAASSSWVNALAYSASQGSWQYSVGKKVVSWDVGYAFRPNDLVQQELRRTLVEASPIGRPVLQAEYFGSDAAWSLVAVNPEASPDALGAQEPALAARYYQRQGAADWFAFARSAQRSGASLGAAVAWVASDALELHASVRALQNADTLAPAVSGATLATQTPWRSSATGLVSQALVGANWTSAQQFGVLLEAWWDGSALAPAQWDAWRQRNQALAALAGQGPPTAALAGNLAWQADALAASGSLQRSNLYLRLSWEHEAWQPTLELLCQPADGGHMATAALRYQGDRLRLQLGVRTYGGPDSAVLAQLPLREQAYALLTLAY